MIDFTIISFIFSLSIITIWINQSFHVLISGEHKTKGEGKAEEESKIRKEYEGVGLENSCKHVDIKRDGGIGDNSYKKQVQLKVSIFDENMS